MGSQELDPEGGCMLVGRLDAHPVALGSSAGAPQVDSTTCQPVNMVKLTLIKGLRALALLDKQHHAECTQKLGRTHLSISSRPL